MREATRSPCRSKRGVVTYVRRGNGAVEMFGWGFNGPPALTPTDFCGPCPGRSVCAGKCGQLSVHAEMRALRMNPGGRIRNVRSRGDRVELVHVELDPDGPGVKPCSGPSCWQCSREILDVGWIDAIWLYETVTGYEPQWFSYTARGFHDATMARCEVVR